jgi:HEAT repeat protein
MVPRALGLAKRARLLLAEGPMIDRTNHPSKLSADPIVRRPPPGLLAAKFPADDDELPADPPRPPGGGGGGSGDDDGNFNRGRVKPLGVILGLLLAAGAAGAIYLGMKSEQAKMTVEQVVTEKKNIFVLPKAEQLPLWRKWAASPAEPALQQEALMQLAWADDPEGVALATKAVEQPDHRVKGLAAQVLAYYGSPKADGAKPALLQALKLADESDRPQIVWALVALKEPTVFTDAMDQYRKGYLSKVERLGGGMVFDPEVLAKLVPLDELAKLAGDESPSVRQLIANVLSKNAEPKWTEVLIRLVKDKDPEVGREAANGLGRIGDETARQPVLEALANADKANRTKFLEALRDGIGGEGLVLALESVKTDPPETYWFQTKQIMDMLRDLADPRSADALVKWVEAKKPALHWEGEVGLRLAEVGDVRAAKYIGHRMLADSAKLYKLERFWEADEGGHMSRGDLQRQVGTRMLADLAVLHPEAKDQLKKDAEVEVIGWLKDRPQPHANGLRFLATVGSEKILNDMRDWAFPKTELPKEGAQPPFPPEFETAQSALRYIGRMKDEASFTKLTDQFKRKKDKKLDITDQGLQGAGAALLGMTLRAVAYGASQGLAEWGDGRAVKPLMELIEDETWHEEAREQACVAVAWCADDKTMLEVAKKAKEFAGSKDARKQFIGQCYAGALSLRPTPEAVNDLIDLLTPDLDMKVRLGIARAIGATGIDAAAEAKLISKLKDMEVRNSAALALILGGSADTAARTVAMVGDLDREGMNDLKDNYFRALGFWADVDFDRGNIYRWVANAEAIARVKVNDVPQNWASQRLQRQFDNLKFDNGPHSQTRVVLRYNLFKAAKSGEGAQKKQAIETLQFMKERGALMALRHEPGETGALAKRAFHDLMHPKAIQAEDLSALQAERKDSK